ncbi:MAG: hypothetical protein FJY17_03165 [Bacteroidetes bacterium]|nr:hypothetical protein [Bacteroidota bacterium]
MRFKLFLFSQVFIGYVFSQSYSTSPVSYYGIGEKSWQSHAIFSSLGFAGLSQFDSTQLNLENPATYSFLSQGNTLFTVGMGGRISEYTSQNASALRSQFMLEQYALGFKMKKNMGLVFSLRPYANRGYHITEYTFTGVDSIRNSYIGKGGMSEFILGMSYRPINENRLTFSLGANLGYAFGASEKIRRVQLLPSINDFPAGEHNTLMRLNNFSVYTSALLQYKPSKNHQFCLSMAYEPKSLASLLRTVTTLSSVSIGPNGKPINAVLSSDTTDSHYESTSFATGIAYTLSLPKWRIQTRELHPTIKFLGTYRQSSSQISNLDSIHLTGWYGGIQFNMEKNLFENLTVLKFAEKLTYRLGVYSVSNAFSEQEITDFGITFGFGIPILIQQSLSSVNFSFQMGERTNESSSLNEKYGGIQVGLIFCPSSFDRWFRKRKLD